MLRMIFCHLSPPFLGQATSTGPRYSPFEATYICTKIFLNQHIFALTYFCTNIYLHQHLFEPRYICTKIYLHQGTFSIQNPYSIRRSTMSSIWCVSSTLSAYLVTSPKLGFFTLLSKEFTWEFYSYLVQPGTHISKYIGQPLRFSFTHVQCPLGA